MMKCMLHHCGAPIWLWREASLYASYLLNRRITNKNTNKTPYELFDKKNQIWVIFMYLDVMCIIITIRSIGTVN